MEKRGTKRAAILLLLFGMIAFGIGGKQAAFAASDLYVWISVGDRDYIFSGSEIVYDGDFWEDFGRMGKFDEKGRFLGLFAPFQPRYCLKNAESKIEAIDRTLRIEPQDAQVLFCETNPEQSEIVPDVPGYGLDRRALLEEIDRALSGGKSCRIAAVPGPIEAAFTAEDARRSLSLCAEFSTDLSSSGENRIHNVALALSAWNGKSFRAGEEVSFNALVGPRTKERGYREAKVIVQGEFTDGVGGGVCQASTTLYNALLLSGNTPTEAHHHSLRVGYVAPSFDAMVSSVCDMKMRCEKPMLHVSAKVSAKRAVVRIYAEPNAVSVRTKSVIVSEGTPPPCEVVPDENGSYSDRVYYEDETLVLQPSKGTLKSEGWLVYGDGTKKRIRSDVYAAQKGKAVKGTHARPDPMPSEQAEDSDGFGKTDGVFRFG